MPGHGRAKIGRLTTAHINTLMKETGVENGSRKLYERSGLMGSVSFQLTSRRRPEVTEQEVTKIEVILNILLPANYSRCMQVSNSQHNFRRPNFDMLIW